MKAYSVTIDHRETDQVFSYYHADKMLHFNASLLGRLHKQIPAGFRRITMDLDQAVYDLCMNNRGIEEPKIAALEAKSLRDPGYGVLFESGLFTIVDGHHRLVRRWRGGVRVMDFWVAGPDVWQHCLVHYAPEFEQMLAEGMPPRVADPEPMPSAVILHPRRGKDA